MPSSTKSTSGGSGENAPLIPVSNQRHVSFAPLPNESTEETRTNSASASSIRDDRMSSSLSAYSYRSNESSASISSQQSSNSNNNNQTNKKFKIHFHEHRLRFDQTYPEGLSERLPQQEFMAILDKIHREYAPPLEESQKKVNKWTVICFSTAPLAIGFLLAPILARHVARHQHNFKTFWRTVKAHLKNLNKETYLARGIEWRIERDLEKVAERDAYNRWHTFRIEVILRKPVQIRRKKTNVPVKSVEKRVEERGSSYRNLSDPEYVAVAAISGRHHQSFLETFGAIEEEPSYDRSLDDLQEEPEAFEEATPLPAQDAEDTAKEEATIQEEEESGKETQQTVDQVVDSSPAVAAAAAAATATAAAIAIPTIAATQANNTPAARSSPGQNDALLLLPSSPPVNQINSPPKLKSYAEMVEAVKALSVEEEVSSAASLVTIPEVPEEEAIGSEASPAATTPLTTASTASFASRQQQKMTRFSSNNRLLSIADDSIPSTGPLAAFSNVDPFAALYETDELEPLYPLSPRSQNLEYVEVDGEVEDLSRKKYRIAPERASRLSKVFSLTDTIQPCSKRSSYVPVNETVRKTMLG